jgi:hypothetical protein
VHINNFYQNHKNFDKKSGEQHVVITQYKNN